MGMDYKEKIRKLLALAQSPNEHEAKAALLKAKQLMAEHKLSEADVVDVSSKKVIEIMTEIQFSKRYRSWISELKDIVGENYCCKAFYAKAHGKQMKTVGFVGFEDDVEICKAIFLYAVDCIVSGENVIRKQYAGTGAANIRKHADDMELDMSSA